MDIRAIDQIHLCINEMQMMKQLLDAKVADDFCGGMLGIYVMMRVDDVTKIWSHAIPRTDAVYAQGQAVKNQYNDGLRQVRDKLGAHFQTPDGKVDLFGSLKIFKTVDYANTVCLIEDIIRVQSMAEGKALSFNGFCDEDLNFAKEVLRKLFSDDTAHLTSGALDIFGVNKGGLMAMTEPQVKAQYLRSIEVMEDIAWKLLNQPYKEEASARMFKRLYVATVYNYHDNLITRTDIKSDAVQYEEGFDKLFLNLISKTDNRSMLEGAFAQFESFYQVESYFKKNRKVRDHACAHLDENSTVEDINKELNALDVKQLKDVYQKMLLLFNFVCKNTLCLKMMTLPARVPIYDAMMETVGDVESFYGEKPNAEIPASISTTAIMRAIRKGDGQYDAACDALGKKLMTENLAEYNEIIAAIAQRLREPSVSDGEITVLVNALYKARSGFPERLQRTLVEMMNDKTIFKVHSAHLLWLLSGICVEDKYIDMREFLGSVIVRNKIVPTSLALLGLLRMDIKSKHSVYHSQYKAHEVEASFKSYCDGVTHPTEKCALMLVLAQRWFFDPEYDFYRKYETQYSDFLTAELEKALDGYFTYIKLSNDVELKLSRNYLNTRHYLLLLYHLTISEMARNQKPNVFKQMWLYNCFFRTRCDVYEAIAVGQMDEVCGNKAMAKQVLQIVVEDNPINRNAIQSLEDFHKRNPELK